MSVIAVERALVILRMMAVTQEGVSVRGVARELGYSPAAAQKLLQALEAQDFARQNPSTRLYELGGTALQVGLSGLGRLEVRRVARPHLEWLAATTEETALLGVPQADFAIYVDQVESPNEIRMNVTPGEPRPFNCTAVGKTLLAFADDSVVDRLAAGAALPGPTAHSITGIEELRAELARVRERGYALDNEEYRIGAACVAAPIRNHDGVVIASISVAGPAYRVSAQRDAIIEATVAAATRVSSAFGHVRPARAPASA